MEWLYYKHLNHVPQDEECQKYMLHIHQIFVGYVNRNVFNVVFIDKESKFYKSRKNILNGGYIIIKSENSEAIDHY